MAVSTRRHRGQKRRSLYIQVSKKVLLDKDTPALQGNMIAEINHIREEKHCNVYLGILLDFFIYRGSFGPDAPGERFTHYADATNWY
jgi:hypothetical protein